MNEKSNQDSYCYGCMHLNECGGDAYHYGDCNSGGPYGVDKDWDINWNAMELQLDG